MSVVVLQTASANRLDDTASTFDIVDVRSIFVLYAQMRNPRRAYDEHGREIEPMTLDQMRDLGPTMIDATCEACRREGTIDVSVLPGHVYVPDVGLVMRLRCSACGGRDIRARPDWRGLRMSGAGRRRSSP